MLGLFILYSLIAAILTRFFPDRIPWWANPLGWLLLIVRPLQILLQLLAFVIAGFTLAVLAASTFVFIVYLKADTIVATGSTLTSYLESFVGIFGISSDSVTPSNILMWVAGLGFLSILYQQGQQGFRAWDEYLQVIEQKKELYWFFYHFRDSIRFFEDLISTAIALSLKYAISCGFKGAVELSCWWIIITYALEVFFIKRTDLFEGVMAVGIAGAAIALLPPFIERSGGVIFSLEKHKELVQAKARLYAALLERKTRNSRERANRT
jgi:hypothetical protein